MKIQNIFRLLPMAILMSGCAFFGFGTKPSQVLSKTHLPKAPATLVPGGTGGNWHYVGTSSDGMLVIEVDDKSITTNTDKNNTKLANFTDRKMVVSMTQFMYPANQPKFKYLISNWQIDCDNKKYIILDSRLYNGTGAEIGHYDYRNNSDVKWLKFGDGSIADLEYAHVCKDQYRNLGY